MTGKPRPTVSSSYPPLLVVAGLLACLLASAPGAGGSLQPFGDNSPAMDFSLVDLKGTTHTLADYRGKIVVVNFWASWCPPCIKEMPGLQRLQEHFGDQPFVILTINVGEQKYRVWKFAKLIDFTLPVLLDTRSKTFEAWGASVLPTSFLLDSEGRIRYRVLADLEWDSEPVVSLISTLLAEQENSAGELQQIMSGETGPR